MACLFHETARSGDGTAHRTAAALAYGIDKTQDRQIAVYDLGGGTGVRGNRYSSSGL